MTMEPAMQLALDTSFGSVSAWREQVAALARTGEAQLAFLPGQGRLVNVLAGAGGGTVPIATVPAGGSGDDVDWVDAYARYQAAVHDASAGCGVDDVPPGVQLLDVRRAAVFAQAPSMLPRARWRDPAAVDRWVGEVANAAPVVVYCVYGHEVGRSTALRLRAAGVDARFLRGGISAWQAAGRDLVPRTGNDDVDAVRGAA